MKGQIKQKEDWKNRMRKPRVVGRIYGMKYNEKVHKGRNRHKNRIQRVGKLGWFLSETNSVTSPP